MDKLIKLFTTSETKTVLGFLFLVVGLLLIGYVLLRQVLGNYFTAILPLPHIESNYTCPYNYKVYTITEAEKDPQNVCGLHIVENKSLKMLASLSGSLTHIQRLTIEDLEDADIPAQIGNLQSLQELYIGDADGDVVIPPEIADLKNLSSLTLSRNEELETLPLSVAKLTHLSTLLLRYNPKLQIPDSLVEQPSLISLSIIGENIKIVPERVYTLPHLQTLDYSTNHISSVSHAINTMTSLQQINFRENNLKTFPEITHLTKLQELDLSHNHLMRLPKGIEQAKDLTTLRLSDNEIDDSSTTALQQLTQLVSLDLGNNKLTKIPDGLEKLQKLQYLRLAGNTINPDEVEKLKNQLPHTTIDF